MHLLANNQSGLPDDFEIWYRLSTASMRVQKLTKTHTTFRRRSTRNNEHRWQDEPHSFRVVCNVQYIAFSVAWLADTQLFELQLFDDWLTCLTSVRCMKNGSVDSWISDDDTFSVVYYFSDISNLTYSLGTQFTGATRTLLKKQGIAAEHWSTLQCTEALVLLLYSTSIFLTLITM